MESIGDLRNRSFRAYVREQLGGCHGDLRIYLLRLVEDDLQRAKQAKALPAAVPALPATEPVAWPEAPHPEAGLRFRPAPTCEEDGCTNPIAAYGWCAEHDPFTNQPEPEAQSGNGTGVVHVELRAVEPAPEPAELLAEKSAPPPDAPITYQSARCLECRRLKVHCTCGQAPRLAEVLSDEAAARDWIMSRYEQCNGTRIPGRTSGKIDGTQRIDIAELVEFTGWERPRAVRFVQRVLDEIRNGMKAPDKPETDLGAQIAAIHEPDDEVEEEIPPAPFPASVAEMPRTPAYMLKGGFTSKREYQAGMKARDQAKKNGKPFDQAKWLKGYRERAALRDASAH